VTLDIESQRLLHATFQHLLVGLLPAPLTMVRWMDGPKDTSATKIEPLLLGAKTRGVYRIIQSVAQLKVRGFKVQLPGFDLREIQDIFQETPTVPVENSMQSEMPSNTQ